MHSAFHTDRTEQETENASANMTGAVGGRTPFLQTSLRWVTDSEFGHSIWVSRVVLRPCRPNNFGSASANEVEPDRTTLDRIETESVHHSFRKLATVGAASRTVLALSAFLLPIDLPPYFFSDRPSLNNLILRPFSTANSVFLGYPCTSNRKP